jgi:CubicO group peptidase (beta-lactamase class C family)
MNRRELIAAAAIASSIASGLPPARAQSAQSGPGASLNNILTPYLSRYQLPAVAAAAVREGQVVASGAVGVRRAGTDTPVRINDAFHIGSDTKGMTSLLAGMTVEEGNLQWSSTIGQSFPELAATMDAGLGDVTLEQLLSHTSGIPSDNDAFIRLLGESFSQETTNLDELRAWLIAKWRNQQLVAKPGTTFAYSNLGYTIAGAMIERAAKTTWEEMIVERIFTPLRLETAGFGPQGSVGRVDAPLGHEIRADGTLKPILAGPYADNPLVCGPTGTVHLSILDFAAWASWQAGEGRRGPALVRPETLRKLHRQFIAIPPHDAPPGTPPAGYYCLGWGIATLPFAREPFLTHTGSNNLNLAKVMLRPEQDFGIVLATNIAGTNADAALKAAAGDIYGSFGPK